MPPISESNAGIAFGNRAQATDPEPAYLLRSMSEDEAARAPQCLSFGPFRLYARERRLERDVEVIKVGSRSLDMIVLTERPGEIISNEELTARVGRTPRSRRAVT